MIKRTFYLWLKGADHFALLACDWDGVLPPVGVTFHMRVCGEARALRVTSVRMAFDPGGADHAHVTLSELSVRTPFNRPADERFLTGTALEEVGKGVWRPGVVTDLVGKPTSWVWRGDAEEAVPTVGLGGG